jgi:hypothetical protein
MQHLREYHKTVDLLSLAIGTFLAGIICVGCTREMPDAVTNRPYMYDTRLWNSFSTQRAIVRTSSDTTAFLASGTFSAQGDDYSLACRLQSQPPGSAPSIVKDESGKYCQSYDKTFLSPQNGSDWSFDLVFLSRFPFIWRSGFQPDSFYAFEMPVSSGSSTAFFRWFSASELQPRQSGTWTISAHDEPLPSIANGRGDGTDRMYQFDEGGLYEKIYGGGNPGLNKIAALSSSILPTFLSAGHCRDDGKTRLYSTDQGKDVVEIEYSAGAWQKTLVTSMPAPAVITGRPDLPVPFPSMFDCLACADPRAEGRQSLYFGSGVCLFEARSTGAQWEQKVVDSIPFYAVYGSTDYPRVLNAACGDIRGDGKPRLYYMARYLDAAYRFALVECEIDTASVWHSQMIVPDLEPDFDVPAGMAIAGIPMVILPVHNGKDGLLIGLPGKTCEISYASGQWTKSEIVPMHASGIAGGAGRNDGVYRVYFTISDYQTGTADEILEYMCSGDVWTQTAAIPGIPAPNGIAVGKGRGDGVVRLYAGGDPLTYEITYGN